MPNLNTQVKIALGYFIVAAVLGVLLRSFASIDISMNYKFIVHTHSHIALLGWVYVALTTLIYKLFVQTPVSDRKYRHIFRFTQLTLIGMLLTFPFQGYALFSIIFSTLFLFASYGFFWFFAKYGNREFKQNSSYKCIKWALWYLVLSSLGPWVLGGIMNTLGAESVWYRLAIYFYLHFQYNGWMMLALFGLFLYLLEQHGLKLSKITFKKFFWGINAGIILSFFLSTLFADPPRLLNVLGGVGALLQLMAFGVLVKASMGQEQKWQIMLSPFQNGLMKTVAVLLSVKMMLQLITAIPYFANLATTVLDFTIGYLHWTFLGVVTMALFLFLDYFKLIKLTKGSFLLYTIGFFSTETLIFYKGIVAWKNFQLFEGYFQVLAIVSFLIPLSLVFMLLQRPKDAVAENNR